MYQYFRYSNHIWLCKCHTYKYYLQLCVNIFQNRVVRILYHVINKEMAVYHCMINWISWNLNESAHICQDVSQATSMFSTLRRRWNRRHFADNIFKCILFNKSVLISTKISLKYIRKGPINDIPALVQIMAWHRPDDKPLSEPMIILHICVIWPQWVKPLFQRNQ